MQQTVNAAANQHVQVVRSALGLMHTAIVVIKPDQGYGTYPLTETGQLSGGSAVRPLIAIE